MSGSCGIRTHVNTINSRAPNHQAKDPERALQDSNLHYLRFRAVCHTFRRRAYKMHLMGLEPTFSRLKVVCHTARRKVRSASCGIRTHIFTIKSRVPYLQAKDAEAVRGIRTLNLMLTRHLRYRCAMTASSFFTMYLLYHRCFWLSIFFFIFLLLSRVTVGGQVHRLLSPSAIYVIASQ